MDFWTYIDKNPEWPLLFLLVIVYGVEQVAKNLRRRK